MLNWLTENFDTIVNKSPDQQKSSEHWSRNIGKIVSGCLRISSYEGADLLIQQIAQVLCRHSNTPRYLLNAQTISTVMYGLKSTANSDGVEALLLAMASHIEMCPEMTAKGIGNALYGLQNLSASGYRSGVAGNRPSYRKVFAT